MRIPSSLALALGVAALSGCTITSMGPESGPPRVESDGLLEGHAAFGWRAEDRFLKLRALDGDSEGAVFEFALWKLFRLELGALGFGVGVGPLDLALGTLFYEPEVPEMEGEHEQEPIEAGAPIDEEGEDEEEDCEICRQARAEAGPE